MRTVRVKLITLPFQEVSEPLLFAVRYNHRERGSCLVKLAISHGPRDDESSAFIVERSLEGLSATINAVRRSADF